MAAGCVPVVFSAGGHKEIISKGKSGFLWKEERSLINYTKKAIEEPGLLSSLAKEAKKKSLNYDESNFQRSFGKLI